MGQLNLLFPVIMFHGIDANWTSYMSRPEFDTLVASSEPWRNVTIWLRDHTAERSQPLHQLASAYLRRSKDARS